MHMPCWPKPTRQMMLLYHSSLCTALFSIRHKLRNCLLSKDSSRIVSRIQSAFWYFMWPTQQQRILVGDGDRIDSRGVQPSDGRQNQDNVSSPATICGRTHAWLYYEPRYIRFCSVSANQSPELIWMEVNESKGHVAAFVRCSNFCFATPTRSSTATCNFFVRA